MSDFTISSQTQTTLKTYQLPSSRHCHPPIVNKRHVRIAYMEYYYGIRIIYRIVIMDFELLFMFTFNVHVACN